MKKKLHRLSQIDEGNRTAQCELCGPVSIRSKGRGAGAKWRCNSWPGGGYTRDQAAYAKKSQIESCSLCGFKPKHRCQMDLDHIDGNHDNNDSSNHQIICSNCHRLKTWEERRP